MCSTNETIAAIVTPPGESGVGIIRISGDQAFSVGDVLFRSVSAVPLAQRRDKSVQYGHITERNGAVIDEVLVLIMKGPHSYTAEDVLEIQCHGGIKVIQKILTLVLEQGVRLARPGEFTERAFVNGRIDLAQAEAVMDIIQAKSEAGVTRAVRQLEGKLSEVVNDMLQNLTTFITRLEVTVDYPEEDLEEIEVPDIAGSLQEMRDALEHMLGRARTGKMIRDGITVVINGLPNAGKSSLLNRLLEEDKAIVTEVPGTTRDVIEAWITLSGIPFCLVDTAGIRKTDDKVERIGVAKARSYMDTADIILLVLDGSHKLQEEEKALLQEIKDKTAWVILNKSDISSLMDKKEIEAYGIPVLSLSARTGKGIEALQKTLLRYVLSRGWDTGADVLLANVRHIEAVRQAKAAMERALHTLQAGLPIDLAIIDIREAWEMLGDITGQHVRADIVKEIFSRFCLGK